MLTFLLAAALQTATTTLPPDAPILHTTKKPAPIYPPIAKAAHISGTVTLQIQIDATGHVTAAHPTSGPAMLQGAAEDAVKKWTYAPVIVDGKPSAVSTTVNINFALPPPINPNDEAIAREFFAAQDACLAAVRTHAEPNALADTCLKAAQIADKFSPQERFIERRSAYVYASGALLQNQQLDEALAYANKAVDVIAQGHDDNSGSSAAYYTRAQAEAALNNLSASLTDFAKAEDLQRKAIASMMPDAPNLVKMEYVPRLRRILNYESQILRLQGHTAEADAKSKEAAKL